MVPIGLAFKMPMGTYGRLAPRSSLSMKGIDIGAGVIDADYRGEIKVVVINRTRASYTFKRGDKICQLIPEKIDVPMLRELASLPPTDRGHGGFGSTGN